MRAILFCFTILICVSCTRQVETFEAETAADYYPAQVGKFRTYRTDSTVFKNFGATVEVHSYQEKHVVDAAISDAAGLPSFRISRFTRSVNATTEPWTAAGYYQITISDARLEVVENNLRVIKLVSPVNPEVKWKGNSYLATDPYLPAYKFDLIRDFADWNYEIKSKGETVSFFGKTYNDVATVLQVDESINMPITSPQQIGYRKYGIEKYAKNIGLVYQELVLWEYQPNTRNTGFSVKRSLIDYN